jgi:hypothetical protein
VLCEIYAKLIGMVIFHYLTAPVRWAERELSATKALHTLRRHTVAIAKAIHAPSQLRQVLDELLRLWRQFALKDRRCSRLSTCTRIDLAADQPLQAPLFGADHVPSDAMPCQVALG